MFETPASTPAPRDGAPPPSATAGLRGFLDGAITRARNNSAMLAILGVDVGCKPEEAPACAEIDRRLRECARRSDFVVRLEDGSWRIVAEFMDGPYAAHRLAHRVFDLLEKPGADGRATPPGSVSIGIATGSGVELDAERLLSRAAEAIRRAQREGGRRLVDAGTIP